MNPLGNKIGSPATGYGKLGTRGFADFGSICWFIEKNGIVSVFDSYSKSPYATKSTEWISFENLMSITYKAEYIKRNNFGGAMVYALNSDDYDGTCKINSNSGEIEMFPLTRKIQEIFNDDLL